jgi:catechol 2,3-dioxygenase
MSADEDQNEKIRVRFSHLGLVVSDIEMMEDFYTRVVGFEKTDSGTASQGITMTFMTLDPSEHHQVFLVEGRPDDLPSNKLIPDGPPVLHHLSFRLDSLSDLQKMYKRLKPEVKDDPRTVTHGVCWAMYAKDPEGNAIEFFADTPWYVHQPFLKPMDFNIDSDTLFAETEALLRNAPGFQPLDDFHKNLEKRIPAKEQA